MPYADIISAFIQEGGLLAGLLAIYILWNLKDSKDKNDETKSFHTTITSKITDVITKIEKIEGKIEQNNRDTLNLSHDFSELKVMMKSIEVTLRERKD